MKRNLLLRALAEYETHWLKLYPRYLDLQRRHLEQIRNFVEEQPSCFERTHTPGHITGSALITTPRMNQVLLTHHKKLNLWLQLGGHSDGDPHTDFVALREAQEESGMSDFEFFDLKKIFGTTLTEHGMSPIFEIDVHKIPARKNEPEHFHYDINFLLVAKKPESIVISDESNDLRWFSLEEAYKLTSEASMHRQFDKLKLLA